MRKSKISAWIILILIFSSCATVQPGNPVASLVPGDAVFYLQLADTGALFNNLDQFLEQTGLTQLLNQMTIREFVRLALVMAETDLNLDWFNLAKPAGFALLPSPDGVVVAEEEPDNFMVILPLNTTHDDYALIEEKFQERDDVFRKKIDDYLIISSRQWIKECIPPARGLDLKQLDKYEPGTLSYYINVNNLSRLTGKSWDELAADLQDLAEDEAPPSGLDKAGLDQTLTSGLEYLKELETITGSLTFNAAGLSARSDIFFSKNGQLAEISKKVKPTANTREMLKYLPADSLFSTVIGFDSTVYMELMEKQYLDLFTNAGIGEDLLREWLINMRTANAALGPRMAYACDFDLALETISALDNPELISQYPGILDKAFRMDILMVADLKDPRKLRDYYKNYNLDLLINKMMAALFEKQEDVTLDLKIVTDIKQDLKKNDFTYSELNFNLELGESMLQSLEPAERNLMRIIMEQLMKKFRIYMYYDQKKYFMVMGYNGLKTLQEVVVHDGFSYNRTSLAEAGPLQQILPLIPENSDLIYQFSLAKTYDLASRIPDIGLPPISLDNAPGLVGFVDINKTSWQISSFWSAHELGRIIDILMPLLSEGSEDTFI